MFAVAPAAALMTSGAQAATDTWSGTAGVNWNTVGSWTTTNVGGVPVAGDTLLYSGVSNLTSNNDFVGLSLGGMTFASGAGSFTLTGNAVALTGALTVNSGLTETVNLALNGTSTSSLV